MKTNLTTISIILIIAFVAGCAPAQSTGLQASGLIEANKVVISSEFSGRISKVLVQEGGSVKTGDVLLILEDDLLQAEKRVAGSALEFARADIKSAETALEATQIQYDQVLDTAVAAERSNRLATWDQAKPTEFNQPTWFFNNSEQYAAVQAEVDAAFQALEEAKARLENIAKQAGGDRFLTAEADLAQARIAFQITQDVLDRTTSASDNQELRDQAQSNFDDAKTNLEDAQKTYQDILTTEYALKMLEERAGVAVAQERHDAAMNTLRELRTGVNSPEVALAWIAVERAQAAVNQAQVAARQAQAHLDLLEVQLEKLSVYAPMDGVVLTLGVHAGEVLQAGMTALTIAKLDKLTVTVYLPEDRYGEFNLGDEVKLSVDSFPGMTFPATIARIADQAEYTPRNVQTKEERQTTVYAIELSVDNTDGKLKPGMPVDVEFLP